MPRIRSQSALYGGMTLLLALSYVLSEPNRIAVSGLASLCACLTLFMEWFNAIDSEINSYYRQNASPGLALGVLTVPNLTLAVCILNNDNADGILCIALYVTLLSLLRVAGMLYNRSVIYEGILPVALGSAIAYPSLTTVFLQTTLIYVAFVNVFQRAGLSFSLGEAEVITQLLTVFTTVWTAQSFYKAGFEIDPIPVISNATMVHHFLFALIFGMLLVGILSYPVLLRLSRLDNSAASHTKRMQYSVAMMSCMGLTIVFVIDPWMWWMTGNEAFMWTLWYLVSDSVHLGLCMWFMFVIGMAILAIEKDIASVSKLSIIDARKLFHILAVILFTPAILCVGGEEFLCLAFAVAVSVFIATEYIRISNVWPLGEHVQYFILKFIDERDSGPIVLTHMYLLLGIALPLWLAEPFQETGSIYVYFASFSGLISLGVGDAVASFVGVRIGKRKWSPRTSKSIEGSIASVIGQLAYMWLLYILRPEHVSPATDRMSVFLVIIVAVCGSTLLEALTDQIDNIYLPSYMFCLLLVTGQAM
eukprot:CFRG1024T1